MRTPPSPLSAWQVVILRGAEQAQDLVPLIQAQGARAAILPVLEILPKMLSAAQLQEWQQKLSRCNLLFAVSSNAVRCAPVSLVNQIKRQANLRIVTMGQATTLALRQRGIEPFLTAPIGSTSESLLTDPLFQSTNIKHKTIGLLAGEDGRTVLAEELTQRGAEVSWFRVYSSRCAKVEVMPLLEQWRNQEKVCFVASSERVLSCLLSLTPQIFYPWLWQCPVIVISQRLAHIAKEQGFKQVVNAMSIDAKSLLNALFSLEMLSKT